MDSVSAVAAPLAVAVAVSDSVPMQVQVTKALDLKVRSKDAAQEAEVPLERAPQP